MLKKKISLKNTFNFESSKVNNNESQFRNNSTNHFYVKDLYSKVLPRINSEKSNYNTKLNDSNNKSSYASTFYSATGNNQRLLTENNQNIKNNNILKYIVSKEKNYLKKKKNLEINPSYFESIPSKKKNNNEIDLYIQEDYDSMGINKDYDYSNLIKKLDRWDEDNCLVNKNDKITLYNILNKFYQKKNMSVELKNLNTLESLLKSKTDYDKILKDRLDYKNSKMNTENLSPQKKFAYPHFNKSHNSRINKKKNINITDIEIDEVKLLSEKIKYETQLHNDLIFVNTLLYNKKILKEEKLKKLEELYKTRAELKQTYDKSYNHNMKDYWNQYDQYEQKYKKLEKLIEDQNMQEMEKNSNKNLRNSKEENKDIDNTKENEKNEENKEQMEENNENNEEKKEEENQENLDNSIGSRKGEKSTKQINKKLYASPLPKRSKKNMQANTDIKRSYARRFSTSQMKFIKEMNFIKATKINSINFEMKRKIEKLRYEYQKKIKDIDEMQKILEEEIQIIKNEISYYKQVNEELVREYRNYYLKILKKGNDHRKEGLVWVVKNLLELQINLEYQHFPKYLTHEHIDYLIELAHLLLEQSELIIIIKVLRKKQTTSYIDENIQAYNMLDKYMEDHLKERDNTNSLMGDLMSTNLYSKNMQAIIREIDKKFENVYKNNKEIVKNYLEKNEEEVKLRNALEHIKKGLYNSDKFVKENQGSILDAFIGNSKNKDFFSFILKIRNRLNQLEVIIKNLIKKEKDYYIEQIQKYNSATKNFDINFYKDVIKKSLFGEKFEIYE